MVYDKSQFPFCSVLEENWELIRDEYYSTTLDPILWPEQQLNEFERWSAYPIWDWPDGNPVEPHIHSVPFTKSLIETHIPTHKCAGFSIFLPDTYVIPHNGLPGDWYRLHLGLKIPDGDAGMIIGTEKVEWEEGKCFVWDDRVRHSAWNFTDSDRVILIIDFVPDYDEYLKKDNTSENRTRFKT
jgi:beta-hydroxylase